jgi:hypothetical protein
MKNLLSFLAFVLMVGSAYAQSNLPACQGSNSARWSNCLGTFTFLGGDRIVSEYQNGMRNGKGIEYDKTGSVLRSGTAGLSNASWLYFLRSHRRGKTNPTIN